MNFTDVNFEEHEGFAEAGNLEQEVGPPLPRHVRGEVGAGTDEVQVPEQLQGKRGVSTMVRIYVLIPDCWVLVSHLTNTLS